MCNAHAFSSDSQTGQQHYPLTGYWLLTALLAAHLAPSILVQTTCKLGKTAVVHAEYVHNAVLLYLFLFSPHRKSQKGKEKASNQYKRNE